MEFDGPMYYLDREIKRLRECREAIQRLRSDLQEGRFQDSPERRQQWGEIRRECIELSVCSFDLAEWARGPSAALDATAAERLLNACKDRPLNEETVTRLATAMISREWREEQTDIGDIEFSDLDNINETIGERWTLAESLPCLDIGGK
jgi:hypothetical protein